MQQLHCILLQPPCCITLQKAPCISLQQPCCNHHLSLSVARSTALCCTLELLVVLTAAPRAAAKMGRTLRISLGLARSLRASVRWCALSSLARWIHCIPSCEIQRTAEPVAQCRTKCEPLQRSGATVVRTAPSLLRRKEPASGFRGVRTNRTATY
jgi:hypothetical protein